MLERGELPNLARIRHSGSYSRLRTTYPAQTPVAWSSFATGTNPGGHGIFDFISRDPATYLPDAALSRFERPKSAFAPPQVVIQRSGSNFKTPVIGPRNTRQSPPADTTCEVRVQVKRDQHKLVIETGG